jgi:actin-related protein
LLACVALAGGATTAPGFGVRLRSELVARLPEALRTRVRVVQDSQRRCAAWIGGSMIASLPCFGEMRVARQDYLEGDGIIQRRAF